MFIKKVIPRIIKDSRGEKTLEVEIETYKGKFRAGAPSGKSTGKHETPVYHSRGIDYSMKILRVFSQKVRNMNFMIKDFYGLKEFEVLLRKFEQKYGKFGANATYVLETAFLKAAAKENNKELWEFVLDREDENRFSKSKIKEKIKIPMPVGNCIGGGLHTNVKRGQIKPEFQEFLLIPNEKTFATAVTKMHHVYMAVRQVLRLKYRRLKLKRNDENAWQAPLNNQEVLELLKKIAESYKVRIGLDVAASSFWDGTYYKYHHNNLLRTSDEQIDYMQRLVEKFKLFYIEDPLQEEDFVGFAQINAYVNKLNKKPKPKTTNALIVGDDLTVTNITRLKRAIRDKSINALIVKPNQNGYMIEVAKVVDFCKKNKIKIIFSHRSGETLDHALADYAVGFQADYIKTGISGRERLVKLARIMQIEKSLK